MEGFLRGAFCIYAGFGSWSTVGRPKRKDQKDFKDFKDEKDEKDEKDKKDEKDHRCGATFPLFQTFVQKRKKLFDRGIPCS